MSIFYKQSGISTFTVLLGIAIVAIVAGAVLLISSPPSGTVTVNTEDWTTYTSEEFDFSIKHPPDWKVSEDLDSEIAPKITFSQPGQGVSLEPPFDHFAPATHVSVYPAGIPTEGVFGETRPSPIKLKLNTEEKTDYILKDGAVWATMVTFSEFPQSWTDSGFLWARVQPDNFSSTCVDAQGNELSQRECDPLTSEHQIIREGEIMPETRATEEAMLKSFEFTKGEEDGNGNGGNQDDSVRLQNPQADGVIASPLEISGQARGPWYFEGSFSVRLTDADGNTIAENMAEAQDDWQTEDFVPFEATLEFEKPDTTAGTLILEKANPSGLPENADQREIPIRFEPQG